MAFRRDRKTKSVSKYQKLIDALLWLLSFAIPSSYLPKRTNHLTVISNVNLSFPQYAYIANHLLYITLFIFLSSVTSLFFIYHYQEFLDFLEGIKLASGFLDKVTAYLKEIETDMDRLNKKLAKSIKLLAAIETSVDVVATEIVPMNIKITEIAASAATTSNLLTDFLIPISGWEPYITDIAAAVSDIGVTLADVALDSTASVASLEVVEETLVSMDAYLAPAAVIITGALSTFLADYFDPLVKVGAFKIHGTSNVHIENKIEVAFPETMGVEITKSIVLKTLPDVALGVGTVSVKIVSSIPLETNPSNDLIFETNIRSSVVLDTAPAFNSDGVPSRIVQSVYIHTLPESEEPFDVNVVESGIVTVRTDPSPLPVVMYDNTPDGTLVPIDGRTLGVLYHYQEGEYLLFDVDIYGYPETADKFYILINYIDRIHTFAHPILSSCKFVGPQASLFPYVDKHVRSNCEEIYGCYYMGLTNTLGVYRDGDDIVLPRSVKQSGGSALGWMRLTDKHFEIRAYMPLAVGCTNNIECVHLFDGDVELLAHTYPDRSYLESRKFHYLNFSEVVTTTDLAAHSFVYSPMSLAYYIFEDSGVSLFSKLVYENSYFLLSSSLSISENLLFDTESNIITDSEGSLLISLEGDVSIGAIQVGQNTYIVVFDHESRYSISVSIPERILTPDARTFNYEYTEETVHQVTRYWFA